MIFTKVCLACAILFCVSGKIVKDSINDANADWVFVTRFCFLSENGKFSYQINYPEEYGPYKLLLYYDSAAQWDTVYDNDDMTCHDKLQPPQIEESNGQIINLEPFAFSHAGNCSYVQPEDKSGRTGVWCELERQFRSSRQRWWYMAISRCNESIDYERGGKKGIVFNYEMLLTNGEELFFKHFSADEFYVLQVDISFLLVVGLLLVISIICAIKLHEDHFFHTTYKLYLTSISLQTIYLFLITICYGVYAKTGVETYPFKMFARVFEIAAYLTYILVLILMAKGFTITRGRISNGGAIKIAIFLTLYTVGFIVLYIFEAKFMDPGKVLYLYESPPGYALVGMRILAWIWFCYGTFFTLKHFPEKKKFYIPFFIFFTLWFWAGPIVILIANFVIADYVRATIVNAVDIFVSAVGYSMFLFLTLPCCVKLIFPFHIKTTQIDVMPAEQYPHENDGSSYQNSSGEQQLVYGGNGTANGHHFSATRNRESSELSSSDKKPVSHIVPNGAPNFRDLFTTSNTHSKGPENSRQRPPAYNPNGGFGDEILIGKRLDEENNPFVSQKEGKAPKPTTPSIAE